MSELNEKSLQTWKLEKPRNRKTNEEAKINKIYIYIKHTCSKRSNVQPKSDNHRKTYSSKIFVGIWGIVPVNPFDWNDLERVRAWEATNQKNENAMKTKTRNTTLRNCVLKKKTSRKRKTAINRKTNIRSRLVRPTSCGIVPVNELRLRKLWMICQQKTKKTRNIRTNQTSHKIQQHTANHQIT